MPVFGFHRIEPPSGLEVTRLSPSRFRDMMCWIADSGLEVATDPGPGKVVLTFDDGMACLAEHALPELRQREWPGIAFLIPAAMGGRDDWDVRILGRARPMMTWEEARIWAGHGIEFGSHSLTHPDLTLLSPRALKAELVESRAIIEDRLGRAVRYLSYPFGRHSARVREAVRDAGYTGAFGIFPTDVGRADRFAIGRLLVNGLTTRTEIRTALSGDDKALFTGPHAWKRRFVHSLNAGSATVSAWRRGWRGRERSDDKFATDTGESETQNMTEGKVPTHTR